MADQEAYDVVAHYDPVAGEIVEPLDKLTVREITCFKINLDEIVDADADTNNGVTFEGDLFMADNSTVQLATVQGVAAAPIDFLDDINFDTNSGVKFGLGSKLSDYETGFVNMTFRGVSTPLVTTLACRMNYLKLGKLVVLTLVTSGSYIALNASDVLVSSVAVDTDLLPPTNASQSLYHPAFIFDNGVGKSGYVAINYIDNKIVVSPIGGFSGAGTAGFDTITLSYVQS